MPLLTIAVSFSSQVHSLLQQVQDRFQTMSDQILTRIDDMGNRIDDLERNLNDLMANAGIPADAATGQSGHTQTNNACDSTQSAQ